jgi:hypothetical protein
MRKGVKDACENSKYIAVLVQNIKGAKTLKDKSTSITFVQYELPFVLFQVYWALYALNDRFTHYDLHTENVLIYEPVKDGFIHYFYHLDDGSVVSFRSAYIAKIIDYGRSYYTDALPTNKFNIEGNSKSIYNTICKIPECKPRCGANVGFEWFEPGYNISSQKSNLSQDLRLLSMLHNSDTEFGGKTNLTLCANVKLNKPLKTLCSKVVFNNKFDTPENMTSGYPAKINNIVDAFLSLKELVQDPLLVLRNVSDYNGLKQLGEMHIYLGRPLEFIPSV